MSGDCSVMRLDQNLKRVCVGGSAVKYDGLKKIFLVYYGFFSRSTASLRRVIIKKVYFLLISFISLSKTRTTEWLDSSFNISPEVLWLWSVINIPLVGTGPPSPPGDQNLFLRPHPQRKRYWKSLVDPKKRTCSFNPNQLSPSMVRYTTQEQ